MKAEVWWVGVEGATDSLLGVGVGLHAGVSGAVWVTGVGLVFFGVGKFVGSLPGGVY